MVTGLLFTYVAFRYEVTLETVALLVAPLGPLGQGQDLPHAYSDAILGIAIGGGVLYVVFLAARGGFGGGDVKLGGFIGAILGKPQIFVALPLSFIAGGLRAPTLLALKVRGRKDTIPCAGHFLRGLRS